MNVEHRPTGIRGWRSSVEQSRNFLAPLQRCSAFILILFLRGWRLFISPLLGCNCRFVPSCSLYMEQSLVEHGFFRGIYKGTYRLCRCNSLSEGGYDPVIKEEAGNDRR